MWRCALQNTKFAKGNPIKVEQTIAKDPVIKKILRENRGSTRVQKKKYEEGDGVANATIEYNQKKADSAALKAAQERETGVSDVVKKASDLTAEVEKLTAQALFFSSLQHHYSRPFSLCHHLLQHHHCTMIELYFFACRVFLPTDAKVDIGWSFAFSTVVLWSA